MSETANEPEVAEEVGDGKKKSKLMLIVGLVVVLLVGGGAGYYFLFASGAKSGDQKSDKNSKKKSKNSSKGGSDEKAGSDPGSDASKSLRQALQDDENVKTVVELQPFIVNLADVEEARYLRMTVSLGIGGDEGGASHEPDEIFLAKVKNAMLAILSVKKSDDVLTVEGKAKLRTELLEAAQSASEDSHVEALYITDFIVQL